jgi:hypothetical protein
LFPPDDIRRALRLAPVALLLLLLGLSTATSLRLAGAEPTLGPVLLGAAIMASLLCPAYLLLAIALGVVGLRVHHGLKASNPLIVALIVSSLVVIGMTVWALNGISSSHASTAVLGVFALPALTLIPGLVSFGTAWVTTLIVGRLLHGIR